MIIEPTGGLSNRLRVVFSYKMMANQLNEVLIVIWIPNNSCNGFFSDYFEELENVRFVDKNYRLQIGQKITYKGFSTHPDFKPDYKDLRLKKEILDKLENRISLLNGDFISAHIRRTDHIELAKLKNRFTEDEDFIEFFKKSEKKIFIATDNPDTQKKFNEIFGDRVVIFNQIEENTNLRMTSLEEAILDIYLCVNAKEFMGSGYSSFTDLIYVLRKNKITI